MNTMMDAMAGHPDPARLSKWVARKLLSKMVGGVRVWNIGLPNSSIVK
jgi:hypothetical protein